MPYWENGKKWCNRCRRLRKPEHFWKNSSTADGYQTICKDCWQELKDKRPDKLEVDQPSLL